MEKASAIVGEKEMVRETKRESVCERERVREKELERVRKIE